MKGQIRALEILTTRFAANGISAYALTAMEAAGERLLADVVAINEPDADLRARVERLGGRVFVLPMRNRNPIAYAARLARIVRDGGYDVVHAHGNSCTLLTEMWAAKRGGAGIRIAHAHNTACRQKLLHALLRRPFDRSYTAAAACGNEAGRFLFRDRPFTVLNNGVDTGRFAFDPEARARLRAEMGLAGRRVLLAVGGCSAQKNQRFLFAPFAAARRQDPSLCLLLAGDGSLLDELKREAEAQGLDGDAVHFLGRRNDVPALLSLADAFLLPSLHEGFPIALVEAQCAGLPCLVADTVTRDAALTPHTVYLPLEPDAWETAICTLACRGAAQRADGADAVRAAGFSLADTGAALVGYYQTLINEKKHPLKKLFVMTHNMAGGGCERVIAQLVNRYAAEGIDCTVLTEYRHESYFPLHANVRLVPLTAGGKCGARDVPRVYLRLRSLVRREKPDLVLAMPEKVNVWTVLFLAGSGTPVVVSERNDPARHPENRVKRLLRHIVYPMAAGFIFQTEQQAAYFSPRIQKRGVVLDNPLELSRLPESYAGERTHTVVTAARLAPQKNLPLLIGAFSDFFRTHPDWRLILYGEGEERETLERLADALPEGVVSLPGAMADVTDRIRTAGMFVLASDFEGMPNALIEAMAEGLPVIATDCPAGGPAALIRTEENGLLVKPGDRAAMANAMARIADDPALALRLSGAAATIRMRLDGAAVAEKWRGYLEGLLG
ncbi:MAG: glycosyltransferase [Eubacteriales bacterium]|nr:glycosyltransferase [Eubacteriales bacterium]